MKEILVQGRDLRLYFSCNICGCEFMCDRDEYEKSGRDDLYDKQYYKTDCPNCHEKVESAVYDCDVV